MGNRFKDIEVRTIETDERGGAEAGAAGGVGCFDVGNFCEIAGCRSAGSNSVISSGGCVGVVRGWVCACTCHHAMCECTSFLRVLG
jgi:hypothetical protein